MEYTKNYHLPQWVEEDRIQMEDFNDAMVSIENGLDAVKNEAAENHAELGEGLTALSTAVEQSIKFVKLGGPLVTTVANGTMTFDLTNANMSDYAALFLTYCAGANTGAVTLSLNGTSLCTVCSNNRTTCAGTVWLVPFNGNVAGWSSMVADATGAMPGSGICDIRWDAISNLTLSGASYAGATATLFGIKN